MCREMPQNGLILKACESIPQFAPMVPPDSPLVFGDTAFAHAKPRAPARFFKQSFVVNCGQRGWLIGGKLLCASFLFPHPLQLRTSLP